MTATRSGVHAALLASRLRPCRPSCCAFDERQQLIHLRHQLAVAAKNFAGRVEADLRPIDQAMGLGQAIDHVRRKLVPLQGHDVDAPRPGRRAFAQHERRHVVQHAAQTADEAVAADRREVVHGHGAGDRRVIVDVHVPAQQRAVGHDDVVAQLAVVGHVAAGHQEILVADPRDAVFLLAAAIDRHAFADHVAVADDDLRVAAGVADVLRLAADDDVRIDHVVAADRHVAHDRHVSSTAACRLAMRTCGPTTENGPISTSSSISAAGSTRRVLSNASLSSLSTPDCCHRSGVEKVVW